MGSTFMGLETNKRGLFTQQSALYTTGHNISNANTLGYSRQRVNMEATGGFPGVGLSAGTMPGFLGTGVQAGSIQRIRDGFVDQQYRQESNKLGYWESQTKAIAQMEDVLNEPSAYGLQKSLSEFWQSLQDLAVNPENGGARSVVVQRGQAVADSFNYMHKSLTEIQTNLGKEISVATGDVNSILKQISELNAQIKQVEPNGYMPNDLYDARDTLLDELSTYFPIETENKPSGGRALAMAEGSVTVTMKIGGQSVVLVEGSKAATLKTNPDNLIKTEDDGNVTNLPIIGFAVQTADGQALELDHKDFLSTGKMKSLMESYGTADGKGIYPDMLAKLDQMANAFAEEFNKVHGLGFPLTSEVIANPDTAFFEGSGAAGIKVKQEIIDNPSLLRASTGEGEEGNGKNAKLLADVQSKGLEGINGATVESFFQGIIGQLGVDGQQAERMAFNTQTLKGAVEHRRASISSVSLDEEMTDMIRFQQAYNASARMITVVDETLDKIINGMGRAGM
ncbi:flagellar hook-associated protein FlgK [Sporosarcina sp. JAI121]|uniref:flagellar hook-associated protein FlgK n=1 Tax=Sporosarcina sp. JAI121 TaxID=2723064 RepID=UPI0015CB83F0|nr:flagellar hook-associated protein FlgK [Sporosarcina sp. JAI121]NYF23921.1 flagellar hook-associated protein 1 FlgK [Sporosarcina sp. JAI121]